MINTQVETPFRKAFDGTSKIWVSPLVLSNGVSMSNDTCGYFSGFDSHHSGYSQISKGYSKNSESCWFKIPNPRGLTLAFEPCLSDTLRSSHNTSSGKVTV